jgi:hypothetical protein
VADGSHNPDQAMEDSTQYDLNEAICRWRQEVGESSVIAQEAIGELESHLVDSVQALRGTGLSAEEAFWVACRRLGSAETLEHEFAKVNPARVWLQRALWMVTGSLVVNAVWALAVVAVNLATVLSHVLHGPSSVLSVLSIVLHYGILTGLLWALWRSARRHDGLVQRVGSWLQARPTLTSVMVAASLLAVAALNMGMSLMMVRILTPQGDVAAGVIWRSVAATLIPIILWPSALAWLLRRLARQPIAE